MPAKVLTDAAVARLKAGSKRREIPDARAAGLHLVIHPSGARSWAMRFRRPDGRNAKLTLGSHCFSGQELKGDPVIGQPLTLAAARLLAADVTRRRRMGIDVVGEHAAAKRRRRVEREQADASTFGVLARQFVEEHARPKVRRWREVAYILGLRYPLDDAYGEPTEARDGLAERWADKPVTAIDAHLVYMTIDEASRRGVPGIKARTKGLSDARGRKMARVLSKFFAWLLQHRRITSSPCIGVYCPPPPASRERVLSADEIRWFWKGCDAVGAPFGPMCKLLLLCGVRREEARALSRAEISAEGLWTIPGSRTKNRKPHSVPLSPTVREIIGAMPRIEGEGYIFTIDGRRPIAGIAKCKERLDAAMLKAACAERGEGAAIPPWRLHDLRRTFVTNLIELGVAPHVVEAAVNHISGVKGSVAGVYNRSELLPERRTALERWAHHIEGIVSGSASKVITLPRKGA
jgi:integrase